MELNGSLDGDGSKGDDAQIRLALLSSSTSRRRVALQTLRERISDSNLTPDAYNQVVSQLFRTYPFYNDRPSRRAVQRCIDALFETPAAEAAQAEFIDALQIEARKNGMASTNYFVLVEWCSILLEHLILSPERFDRWGMDIVTAHARLLESCVTSAAKRSVRYSATIVTRRALRKVFTEDGDGQRALKMVIPALTNSKSACKENAVFLGIVAEVCARLPKVKPSLEAHKKDFLGFFAKEIIGSRVAVPSHIAAGLNGFFKSYAATEDIQKEVVPALEKALLRAPELVLSGLIPAWAEALPADLDLSESLHTRLLKPLLTHIKSTNVGIRSGALLSFVSVVARCHDGRFLLKSTEEILLPLKNSKLPNTEHRTLQAQMLSAIPASRDISLLIVRTLTPVCAKEASEAALVAETSALAKHISHAAKEHIPIDSSVFEAIAKGCGDKRNPFRKAWITSIGEALWELDENILQGSEISKHFILILMKMSETFEEIVSNPMPFAQGGFVAMAFVFTSLCQAKVNAIAHSATDSALECSKVRDRSLATSPKISFLLNSKIYTKLTSPQDIGWMLRALSEVSTAFKSGNSPQSTSTDAWSQSLLFLLTAIDLPPDIQRETARTLNHVYSKTPADVGKIIISGIWNWIRAVEQGDKDSAAVAAKSGLDRLHIAVKSITPVPDEILGASSRLSSAELQDQLISILVLCQPQLLPRTGWIDMVLKAGVDPGALAEERASDCIKEIIVNTEVSPQADLAIVQSAAYHASAELAFVAPNTIVPEIVKIVESDLNPSLLAGLGPTEAAIAKTPENVAFIDVLSSSGKNHLSDKNIKDYDTLKWEEELKSQIAKKKGQQRKLTADETVKVNAQLAKEAGIRKDVLNLERRIKRGAGVARSLAEGPPTDAAAWINPILRSLLAVAKMDAGLFVGDVVSTAVLSCSSRVTSRLGTLRPFIGIATLRAYGESYLTDEYSQEPLGDLVTRVLYRFRFAAEQRPIDVVSLAYVIPLTLLVLEKGGLGFTVGDEADEQIHLALEFLSFQTDLLSDSRLPRGEILSCLISSMRRYTQHYRLIKDALLEVCRCISSNLQPHELEELLKGTVVPEVAVRTAVLQAIHSDIDLIEQDFIEQIWLECHDGVGENVEIAEAIWEENGLEVDGQSGSKLLPYLKSPDIQLRTSTSKALAHSIKLHPSTFSTILGLLQTEYRKEAAPKVPQRDAYGLIKKTDLRDPWEARSGIALAFKEMTEVFEATHIVPFMEFMIHDGPLGDHNSSVRQQMAEGGVALIASRGSERVEELMKLFEHTIETSDKASEQSDWINEAVVVLYGSLARHLKKGDPRLKTVVEKLLSALSTPSETVQYAVAECICPLAPLLEVSEYIQLMLDQMFKSKKYASRRGAAYGLAGIVRGKGISTLREYRLMSILKESIENKKDQNARQGALFGYELLSLILGRTFEPYIIQILPQLLSSFGDPSTDVREACLDTAKTCFASLSSYGVKQILPTLLEGLDEPQWRSKKGACDLLGAMAYLDPHQLAISLPDIIPPLTSVLNDSHKEVRAAANRSLQRFGEVISNPEVKSLVDILLKALSDPTKYTEGAMDALIKVSFVHYLDAPSLALVARVLERGLGDRSTAKRKSAQIIGSLAHLTERKDLISHLPIMVSGLRVAAVDPVPATRATASKALGSLIEKLGEDALPDLIPSLMSTLKSDTGAGDRLGSAQALSEVLAGLGTGRLEETLPSILQNVSSNKASIREGFMSLFIFLPACFGNSFANYLNKIIPPILAGLADDVESIRDTSLRAGRLLVKNFASKAIDLLLPELERGLADDSHRIRLSSVELVGDLLFNLTGITVGKADEEEDEDATQAGQSLLEVLGEDRRNKVLSALYICRCDTSGLVRTAAITVWKALVASPRTLKELVPTLSQLIIRRLASSNMEQKVIASNALGELIRKAGEGVLSTLLPTLEEGLQTSTDSDSRQGICIALRELIASASPDMLEDYEKTLISVIRTALVDSDADVREAAAEAFDALQKSSGKRVVDQVLPYLLNLLRNEDEADQALAALLTLLTEATRSNIILPNLVPTLLAPPISSFNAKALASLAQVAGPSMTRRLPAILNALMDNLISCKDEDLKADLDAAFDSVLLSVDEFDGLNTAMSVMISLQKHDDHKKRAAAAFHFAKFFTDADVDFSRYNQDLIRVLLISFDDRDSEVVKASWAALSQLMTCLRKEEMESLVISTRQVLQQVGVAGSNLPGFGLPKGINAILPIFLQGLMNGTPDQRTQAALAISDVIDRTSPDALKPFVTQITGPLIRVVSERSTDVKCAIILTLNNLLEKIPLFLKPFLPQLQRTFAKSLADTSSETLRVRAAKALGTLITLTPRVDPLIAELVTGSKTQDVGVKNAMLKALHEVVSKAGANMSDTSRQSILGLIDGETDSHDDSMAISNARLLGALLKNIPTANATSLIKQRVLTANFTKASILNLNAILVESPSLLIETFPEETPAVICEGITNPNPFISESSILAAGKFLLIQSSSPSSSRPSAAGKVLSTLSSALNPQSNPSDTRRLSLVVMRTISRTNPSLTTPSIPTLAPAIFSCVRDPVIPVKLAAEAAFVQLFNVVDEDAAVFEAYLTSGGGGGDSGPSQSEKLPPSTKRSMSDYFKRVALRLGALARERRDAEGGGGGGGGGSLGLSIDEQDDEREIWSVGRVEVGPGVFSND